MRITEHTILISRPPDAVFDFFVDFSQAPKWRQYVVTMQRIDDGPLRAGSRLRVSMDVNGGPYEFEMEVLVCDRPNLWRHRSNEGEFKGYVEYKFEPEQGGTRVTLAMEAKPASLYGWLAMPLMWLRKDKPYADQLPRLKRALEAA
jgi:uncharacterized membrane protein